MRAFLFCVVLILFSVPAFCRHIKGGWVQYEYMGAGSAANTSTYKITVYVFKTCSENGPMPSSLGIYDAVTYASVVTVSNTSNSYTLQSTPTKTSFDPCLSNPPTICYQVYTYSTTVTLPDNTNGYIIAASDANRVSGIINITNSVSTGISFLGSIPGTINGTSYRINSSPFFNFKDTAIICYGSKFLYQFSATDADASDVLTYSFGNGINGTSNLSSPPYSSLTYTTGFTGASPLGSTVTIDSLTGLVSGTAPVTTGEYVIAVYVHEWRNGVLINSTKKELQINVANCSLSAAQLKSSYLNCDNFSFTFQNESAASNITSYLWDFGVTNSTTDISTSSTPVFTYADTGLYMVKLTVSNTGGCQDSAKAPVKVYPGFAPSFTVKGSCYQSPFLFSDASVAKYGSINSWLWDLGDTSVTTDTSTLQNPVYLYPAPGRSTAILTVTSTLGCSGSYSLTVVANDKPVIYRPFTDTLICSVDSLQINSQATGTYSWSPNYNISNTSLINPVVYPKDTTTYTLTVTDQGCIDSARFKVNVVQFITVKLPADTGICQTDHFLLRPASDAISYLWTESGGAQSLNSYTIKNPSATPLVTTTYSVTANLGYCQDHTQMTVYVSPYPKARLGNDTTVCFGSRVQLSGAIAGAYYSWSPAGSLSSVSTLSPVAAPVKTTNYILTVSDTAYCKKEFSDTLVVKVVPLFNVNAGKDTSAALGQPLQLNTSGADTAYKYQWLPTSYLQNPLVRNPVFLVTNTTLDSILYSVKATSPEGCTSSDDIMIRIYKNGPDILVPSAFTPNGDGLNDILRPILIGIAKLNFFSVYNRFGELIYSTSEREAGWNGLFKNQKQGSGTYVYMTKGVDIAGNVIFRSGTTVLIR